MYTPIPPERSVEQFIRDFRRTVRAQNVPLSGTWAITHRCTVNCVHCFVREEGAQGELTLDECTSVMDQLAEAGCLTLLITGGEPMLRKDFPEFYRAACERGFLVSVFTNGTLVNQGIIDLFRALPPRMVEVSLYGGTRETYDQVTRNEGGFDRCMRGVGLLAENGFNLRLKTVLMTLNKHELPLMEGLAKDLNVEFRYDAGIFPRLDGDKRPLAYRVDPADVIDMEFKNKPRSEQWGQIMDQSCQFLPSEFLYGCGAGSTGFHINPRGFLQPCMMTPDENRNLRDIRFMDAWKAVVAEVKKKKMPAAAPCRTCQNKNVCGYCPAFFKLENGAETERSCYLCTLGHRRVYKIKELRESMAV